MGFSPLLYCSVPRLGNSSFTGKFRISPHGCDGADDAHLEAEIIYVSVTEEGRSTPIPGWVRERIAAVESATVDEGRAVEQ